MRWPVVQVEHAAAATRAPKHQAPVHAAHACDLHQPHTVALWRQHMQYGTDWGPLKQRAAA